MITLRRANERHHDRLRNQDVWHTFFPAEDGDGVSAGFGTLEAFTEDRLPPGAGIQRRPNRDADIVTYVHEGKLAHEDSLGHSAVVHACEFQRVTVRSGVRHSETNASRTDWAHVFQLWLRPSGDGLVSSQEQRRFSAAHRRGGLCIIASPDGRAGSLHLHQDALMYSALLDPGQHVVHELAPGRSAWLHVVSGEAAIDDVVLKIGDGVGITEERAVSFTAAHPTEVILLDLCRLQAPPPAGGRLS
jgi:redox-sensitive bicupin YhaK (pirin superfamily)